MLLLPPVPPLFPYTTLFRSDLAEGFLENVKLSLVAAVASLILGTILVAMRVSPVPVLRVAGTVYVNVVRNTPLTLVLADRKSTRLNSSHLVISYAVFCLKKK